MEDKDILLKDVFSALSKLHDFTLKNAYFVLYEWVCKNESSALHYIKTPIGICTFESPIINSYYEREVAVWHIEQKANPCPAALLKGPLDTEDISCVKIVFENVEVPNGERSES